MLKDTQTQLSKTLSLSDKRVKKFKIQKRGDDNTDNVVFTNVGNQNRYVVDTDTMQVAESVGHHDFAAPHKGYHSGYDNRKPFGYSTNISNEQVKRSEDDDDLREAAEEYDEEMPSKSRREKPLLTYPSTNRNEVRQQNEEDNDMRDKFSTTVAHNGRGYHTSYFIPNTNMNGKTNDNGNEDNDRKWNVRDKSNEFTKSGSNQQMTRSNKVKPNDVYVQKTVHDHDSDHDSQSKPRSKPRTTRPSYRPNDERPIRYSQPIPNPVAYPQPILYGQMASDLPYLTEAAQVYGYPPVEYQENPHLHRKPVSANNGHLHRKAKPSSEQESRTVNHSYKPREPNRRAPVFVREEHDNQKSDNRKSTPKPVHWTRIVSELSEQKNNVNENWRQQSRPLIQKHLSDSSDNKYYKLGASVRSH